MALPIIAAVAGIAGIATIAVSIRETRKAERECIENLSAISDRMVKERNEARDRRTGEAARIEVRHNLSGKTKIINVYRKEWDSEEALVTWLLDTYPNCTYTIIKD